VENNEDFLVSLTTPGFPEFLESPERLESPVFPDTMEYLIVPKAVDTYFAPNVFFWSSVVN
jgi:hypothetical protein